MTESASAQITGYINTLHDWRGELMSKLRKQILEAAQN